MNVESPPLRSSCAPIRVKMRSHTPIVASSAGTYEPICASSTMLAVWRRYVDLPAMFGPVRTMIRALSSRLHVVGHEPAGAEHALHQRMASAD